MKKTIRFVVALLLAASFAPLQAQAFSGGFIDGIVTLSKANSPYTLTQTIQIPKGSTLKVEPGVVLKVKHANVVFKSAGNIELLGTFEEKIKIESAVILFESAVTWPSRPSFKAKFVEATGISSVFTSLNQGQDIELTDSVFLGNAQQNQPIYNWLTFCVQCSFERNVFKALPGFQLDTYDRNSSPWKLANNLFIGNSTSSLSFGDSFRNGEWIDTDGNISLVGNSFIKFKKPVIQQHNVQKNVVLDENYFEGKTSQDLNQIAVRDLSGFQFVLNSPLAAPNPLTPSEPAISLAPPKDFGWKFKGSTLEVKTTKLASPSDTIRVDLAGKQYSTFVISNANVVTLNFSGVTLGGPTTNTLLITSRLFRNEFAINETFSSCEGMWAKFDGGIAKAATSKNKGVKTKKKATIYPVGYSANLALDKDRDGLVCER